jgi:hypothetical protein
VLGYRIFLVGQSENFHFFRNHESGIKSKSKMSDDRIGIVFIFFKKIFSTRKCNLIDELINFIGSHSYSSIGNGERFFLFIELDANRQIA